MSLTLERRLSADRHRKISRKDAGTAREGSTRRVIDPRSEPHERPTLREALVQGLFGRGDQITRAQSDLGGFVHLGDDLPLHRLEHAPCHAPPHQISLEEPDGIPASQKANSCGSNVSLASRSSCVAWPPIRKVCATIAAGPSPERHRSAAARVAAYTSRTLLPSQVQDSIPYIAAKRRCPRPRAPAPGCRARPGCSG